MVEQDPILTNSPSHNMSTFKADKMEHSQLDFPGGSKEIIKLGRNRQWQVEARPPYTKRSAIMHALSKYRNIFAAWWSCSQQYCHTLPFSFSFYYYVSTFSFHEILGYSLTGQILNLHFKFYKLEGHWRLTWSLTSEPIELVEIRVNWPGHPY